MECPGMERDCMERDCVECPGMERDCIGIEREGAVLQPHSLEGV